MNNATPTVPPQAKPGLDRLLAVIDEPYEVPAPSAPGDEELGERWDGQS